MAQPGLVPVTTIQFVELERRGELAILPEVIQLIRVGVTTAELAEGLVA